MAASCQADRQRWLGLLERLREVAALHDGLARDPSILWRHHLPLPTRLLQVLNLCSRRCNTQAMMLGSAEPLSMAALDADAADSGDSNSPQFAFEMSPHTLRLHPFRRDTSRPLAMSLRPEETDEELGELAFGESEQQHLLQQARDFQKAWKSLTPLQQKMARGRPHRAEVGGAICKHELLRSITSAGFAGRALPSEAHCRAIHLPFPSSTPS